LCQKSSTNQCNQQVCSKNHQTSSNIIKNQPPKTVDLWVDPAAIHRPIRGGKSGETARPLVALGSASGHESENPDLNDTGTLTGKDEMAKHGILTLHNLKFFWSSGKRMIFFGRWGLKIS